MGALAYFLAAVSAATLDESNEKLIRVWEDRIQNTELDADEVNFPLFLEPDLSLKNESLSEPVPEVNSHASQVVDALETPDINHGFITIRSNFTSNNITRHDVSHIPMHAVGPLIKNALSSLTGEEWSIVALGGLLPLMALFVPITFMAVMLPILLTITLTMFGILTIVLFFAPMALILFGTFLGVQTVLDFPLEKLLFEPFSQFESFEAFDDVVLEKIQKTVENITIADEETTFQPTVNDIPRFFS